MIEFEEGLVSCGRVTMGNAVGYIVNVGLKTYRVRWLDGNESTLLRPDLEEDDQVAEVA